MGNLLAPISAQSSTAYFHYHFIAMGGLEHSKAHAVPRKRETNRKSGLVFRGYKRKNLKKGRKEDQQVEQQRRRQASCMDPWTSMTLLASGVGQQSDHWRSAAAADVCSLKTWGCGTRILCEYPVFCRMQLSFR